jgi:hypothetical protein
MKREEDIASSLFAGCKYVLNASSSRHVMSPPRVAIFNRIEQQVAGASLSPWRPALFTFWQSTTGNCDVIAVRVMALLIVAKFQKVENKETMNRAG